MRRTWRNLFYFSKADRRAVLLLAGVLMGIVLSTSFFLWFDRRTPAKEDSGDSLVYERFFAGLKPDTVVVVRSGQTYGQPVKAKPATFFFDPNTADSTALLRLGLSPWQVRNIYKYRTCLYAPPASHTHLLVDIRKCETLLVYHGYGIPLALLPASHASRARCMVDQPDFLIHQCHIVTKFLRSANRSITCAIQMLSFLRNRADE